MTLSYRKRYPASAARATTHRHVLALLRRTPGRRTRWHHQAQRRRPWLLRPLTAGEKALLTYKGIALELSRLLEPFRRTRPQGHHALHHLLHDADTRPAVVEQVHGLTAYLDQIRPEHHRQGQQIERWRQEWDRTTEAQRHRLQTVDKAVTISQYHDGLRLLLEEAKNDLTIIKGLCPEAFKPVAAPEPWLDGAAPAGPTPYSA